MRFAIILASALFVVGGCKDGPVQAVETERNCLMNGPSVRPVSATLHPGDTLQAYVIPNLCSSPQVSFRWVSNDTAVARVDSLTGLIRARSPGRSSITVIERQDPTQRVSMALDVIP
ncbi:MAG TPA: Ig-like domain-containing protein [Gemmatimonadaceae bacterium]